jgi:hypothetical protein
MSISCAGWVANVRTLHAVWERQLLPETIMQKIVTDSFPVHQDDPDRAAIQAAALPVRQ